MGDILNSAPAAVVETPNTEDEVVDAISRVEEVVTEIEEYGLDPTASTLAYGNVVPIRFLLPQVKQTTDDRRYNRRPITGIPTGLRPLDTKLKGGIQPKSYIGIIGLPKAGKTRVMSFIALNAARAGTRTLFASLEMPASEMYNMWAGMLSGVSPTDVELGGVFDDDGKLIRKLNDREYRRWDAALVEVSNLPIRIIEGQVSALDIKREIEKYEYQLGIVDYLQKLSYTGESYSGVGGSSNTLRQIAMKRGTPIIIGLQANRAANEKPDKRVEPHHAALASAIEKDVTHMIGIWRKGLLMDVDERPEDDEVELDLMLSRDGKTGRVRTIMHMPTGWMKLAPKRMAAEEF
jgi:replicative DNA helicase